MLLLFGITALLVPLAGASAPCTRPSHNIERCGSGGEDICKPNGFGCAEFGCADTFPLAACFDCCEFAHGVPTSPDTDPSPKTACDTTTGGGCFITPSQWQSETILEYHNLLRADHESGSIIWNEQVSIAIRDSPLMLAACSANGGEHPSTSGAQNNESIYESGWSKESWGMQSFSKDQLFRWSGIEGEGGVRDMYCKKEGCWMYTSPGSHDNTFKNIIWNLTTEVACAMCSVPTVDNNFNVTLGCVYKNNPDLTPLRYVEEFEFVSELKCVNGTWDSIQNRCECPADKEIGTDLYARCPGQYQDANGVNQITCTMYARYKGPHCGQESLWWGVGHVLGPYSRGPLLFNGLSNTTYILYVDEFVKITATYGECYFQSTCIKHVAVVTKVFGGVANLIEFISAPTKSEFGDTSLPWIVADCYAHEITFDTDPYLNPKYSSWGSNYFSLTHSESEPRRVIGEVLNNDGIAVLFMEITASDAQYPTFHMDLLFEYVGPELQPAGLVFDADFSQTGLSTTGETWIDPSPYEDTHCKSDRFTQVSACVPSFFELERRPQPQQSAPGFLTFADALLVCEGNPIRIQYAQSCCEFGIACQDAYPQCIAEACLYSGVTFAMTDCPTYLTLVFQDADSLYDESCYCSDPNMAVDEVTGECDLCRSNWYPILDDQSDDDSQSCLVYCDADITCGGMGTCNEDGLCECNDGQVAECCTPLDPPVTAPPLTDDEDSGDGDCGDKNRRRRRRRQRRRRRRNRRRNKRRNDRKKKKNAKKKKNKRIPNKRKNL